MNSVMPMKIGIHAFSVPDIAKAWMPTSVGMTGGSAETNQNFRPLA